MLHYPNYVMTVTIVINMVKFTYYQYIIGSTIGETGNIGILSIGVDSCCVINYQFVFVVYCAIVTGQLPQLPAGSYLSIPLYIIFCSYCITF